MRASTSTGINHKAKTIIKSMKVIACDIEQNAEDIEVDEKNA